MLPVDHNSCANAIAHREIDHIRDILCNPKVSFTDGGTVGNRVGEDGNIKVVAQVIQYGDVVPVDTVDRIEHVIIVPQQTGCTYANADQLSRFAFAAFDSLAQAFCSALNHFCWELADRKM